MPNWCSNGLEISKHNESGRKLIDAFRPKHDDGDGKLYATPFQDLLPVPLDLKIEACHGTDDAELLAKYEANKKKYGSANWYDWCIANWGTKWDACDIDITWEGEESVCISFATAWSPPSALLQWYAEEHPDVVFLNEFEEDGCAFEGYDCNSPLRGFVGECWERHSHVEFHELMNEAEEFEK